MPVVPHWSVTMTDATARDLEGKPLNVKENDLLVEIDRKGEEYLRKRLRQITGSNSNAMNTVKSKRNSLPTIIPVLTNSEKITKETVRTLNITSATLLFVLKLKLLTFP